MFRLVAIVLTLLCFLGCASSTVASETEVAELLRNGAVLVDVRTQSEFDSGHLKDAIHLPYERISELPQMVKLSKDTPVVVYCRSGNRSGKAKATLDGLGYTRVVNGGGYSDLKSSGVE